VRTSFSTAWGTTRPWRWARPPRAPSAISPLIGLGGGTLPISFFAVPYELSVQTTYGGSRPELIEVLDLASRGLLHAT